MILFSNRVIQVKFCMLLALMCCQTGCVLSQASFEVVEKSKINRPGWAQWKEGFFHDNGATLDYLLVRKKQSNLQLGIRQAHSVALSTSQLSLTTYIQGRITGGSPSEDLNLHPKAKRELDRIIIAALALGAGRPKVADTYFEQVVSHAKGGSSQRSRFFNTYVLVSVDKAGFVGLFNNIAYLLRKAEVAELQALARKLSQKDAFEFLTH